MTNSPSGAGSSIWLFSTSNSAYLPRLVELDRSLGLQNKRFHKTYLNLDDISWPAEWEALLDARIVQLHSLLDSNPQLAVALEDRNLVERFFTVGPQFLVDNLSLTNPGDWIVYCDADLKFFASIEDVLAPFESHSVLITPHNHFWWNRARLKKYGKYNVGLVAFRHTPDGLRALKYWSDSCIDWCYDKVDGGRYADQKYLEDLAHLGFDVAVDSRRGSNLAPWNASLSRVTRRESGEYFLGESPILYFHMQGLKRAATHWVLGHLPYLNLAGPSLKREIYLPYVQRLEVTTTQMKGNQFSSVKAHRATRGGLIAVIQSLLQRLLGQTIPVNKIEELNHRDSD